MTSRKVLWRGCKGKTRYADEHQALRMKRRREQEGARPLRVYACRECGGFHLTGRAA